MRRLIESKRDGEALGASDWELVVADVLDSNADKSQVSALLMACVFRGLTLQETVDLTRAIVQSGEVVHFTAFSDAVDKHSSGGVGDTASLILVPVLAACGKHVAKLSGRALGHTGGTLDKLESIPGLRVDLSPAEFEEIIARTGCAIAAQSSALVPGDKALYALRDRTGTVPCIGLMAASIVGKKIAGGATDIVFDVKTGTGAFMKTFEEARTLASFLVRVAREFGRRATAVITDMEEPLCPQIGTGLEVIAARNFLAHKERPERLEKVIRLVALELLKLSMPPAQAAHALDRAMSGADALERFERMIAAQGGDVGAFRTMQPLEVGAVIAASRDGFVTEIEASAVGQCARRIVDGSGPLAGITMCVEIGSHVKKGDALARIHGDPHGTQGELSRAFEIHANRAPERPLVYDVVTAEALSGASAGVPCASTLSIK